MRQASAIFAVLTLLLGPFALLVSQSCASPPACCSKDFCPLPGKHGPAKSAGDPVSHHPSPAAAGHCAMNAGCSSTPQTNVVSPLPPAVLQAAAQLPEPDRTQVSVRLSKPFVLSGIVPVLLKPPQS